MSHQLYRLYNIAIQSNHSMAELLKTCDRASLPDRYIFSLATSNKFCLRRRACHPEMKMMLCLTRWLLQLNLIQTMASVTTLCQTLDCNSLCPFHIFDQPNLAVASDGMTSQKLTRLSLAWMQNSRDCFYWLWCSNVNDYNSKRLYTGICSVSFVLSKLDLFAKANGKS